MREKRLSRKNIYKGRIVNLAVDEIEINGRRSVREVVLHPGSAVIIPIVSLIPLKIILIRQYRYAAGKVMIELPAGTMEKNEHPRSCALREIEEETGYKCSYMKKIGTYYPAPGALTEVMGLYAAWGLKKTAQNTDFDESIEPFIVTLKEAVRMVLSGRICDGKTSYGILLFDALVREKKFPLK